MRLVVVNNVTLDGVMQAPARPDEDRRGGFGHGGWGVPGSDAAMGERMGQSMARSGSLLLGRRTYEDFYQVWPGRSGNPYTEVLNNTTKYVASETLAEPLPWANSVLLKGDAADAVAGLRQQPGKDLVILGSGELIRSLLRRQLIDEFLLLIHPVALGTGRRLFPDDAPVPLRLADSVTTPSGVIIATYRPAEPPAREPG